MVRVNTAPRYGVFWPMRRLPDVPHVASCCLVLYATSFMSTSCSPNSEEEMSRFTHPSPLPPEILMGGAGPVHEGHEVMGSCLRRLIRVRGACRTTLDEKWWPESLRKIQFSPSFWHPLTDIIWPDSLTHLVFGHYYDRPFQGVHWPASLQLLTFGHHFNWPLEGVKWPDSLQQLTFGNKFNKPIRGIVWPDSLQGLTFGFSFNYPIEGLCVAGLATSFAFWGQVQPADRQCRVAIHAAAYHVRRAL